MYVRPPDSQSVSHAFGTKCQSVSHANGTENISVLSKLQPPPHSQPSLHLSLSLTPALPPLPFPFSFIESEVLKIFKIFCLIFLHCPIIGTKYFPQLALNIYTSIQSVLRRIRRWLYLITIIQSRGYCWFSPLISDLRLIRTERKGCTNNRGNGLQQQNIFFIRVFPMEQALYSL